jgi:hypothetical protein
MWIVILNFCVFLLLICIFLYGLNNWHLLINVPDETDIKDEQVETFYYRAPLWVLIFGCATYSIIAELLFV